MNPRSDTLRWVLKRYTVDDERLAIARALGVAILAEPDLGVRQGYMTEPNYSTAPGFRGIKAQNERHGPAATR